MRACTYPPSTSLREETDDDGNPHMTTPMALPAEQRVWRLPSVRGMRMVVAAALRPKEQPDQIAQARVTATALV